MHKANIDEGKTHIMNSTLHNFKIEERRRKVASLIAQSYTEEEIAQELRVNQSTISRDISVLRQMSQQFIYDLAKSDLAYSYKTCINGIEEVKRQVWELFRNGKLTPKDRLAALKLAKECNEGMFSLLNQGPSVLAVKTLEERVNRIIEVR